MLAMTFVLFLGAQTAPSPSPVSVTGCLTTATTNGQQQFTLTTRDTNRAAADVKTETYQLTPRANVDLTQLVNRRVEVTGTERAVAADATTIDSTRDTAKPAGTSGKTPTVETKTRADIVVHQMNVTAARALAGDCRVP